MSREDKTAFRNRHYHRKRDGILRIGFRGESDRFLTWWETIQFYLGLCP